MRRDSSVQFGFPRFTGNVRNLILANTAVFVVLLLARAFGQGHVSDWIFSRGIFNPEAVKQAGWIWQFLTYGFIHVDPLNFLFSMLALFFLGSAVESRIGKKLFLEFYLFALIGAGLAGFLLSFIHITPQFAQGAVYGSGPAANAILMMFFLLFRDAPIMVFPIPIPIPVKYIVIFTAAVEGAYLLLSQFSLFFMVQLLGLGAGYAWYKFAWRRAKTSGAIESRIAAIRNAYYRWKRRRAARKFKVYMSMHQHDPKQYFDEYGNFRPPDEDDKKGRGGWVN
ncbi:MAG TPA: rhomboid family intramembrane serine protease [Candidatus Angelobacter sp.]|nr:rhomboid family intramembrane serine protease [Candidatus Angelobacter sp.]